MIDIIDYIICYHAADISSLLPLLLMLAVAIITDFHIQHYFAGFGFPHY
jgi:hypothetical protein